MAAVTKQPQQVPWMPMPQNVPQCPPGLEYLTTIDQLLVHQKVELLEAFVGFESKNKYEIKNTMGQRVYLAAEDTGCCNRNCCGTHRPFDIQIIDNYSNEVMHLNRDLRCDTCWCPCCLQKVEVTAPPGNVIGYVEQAWSIGRPKYNICDASGETVLKVAGPCFTCNMCGDVEFQIFTKEGDVQIGEIRKQWTGLVKEAFTDADNFGVTFPLDLDVKVKATLIGAIFLIDFMFFEKTNNKESDGPGMLS